MLEIEYVLKSTIELARLNNDFDNKSTCYINCMVVSFNIYIFKFQFLYLLKLYKIVVITHSCPESGL